MREILFRGKRTDNGEWVEGWYEPPVKWGGHSFGTTIAYICSEGYLDDAEVDPTTVGQYTGLQDKNGKRIFEGDIIKTRHGIRRIVFEDGVFGARANAQLFAELRQYKRELKGDWEVIGNIHDNPELVKGGNHG